MRRAGCVIGSGTEVERERGFVEEVVVEGRRDLARMAFERFWGQVACVVLLEANRQWRLIFQRSDPGAWWGTIFERFWTEVLIAALLLLAQRWCPGGGEADRRAFVGRLGGAVLVA